MSGLSLYTIEQSLTDLLSAREELLDPMTPRTEESAAELAEVEKALAEYAAREVSKCDGIHSYLRWAENTVNDARREAAAFAERARRIEESSKRLKALVCDIMAERGLKRIDGTAGRMITRNGNGGLAPLVVQEDVLPDDWRDITITMPLNWWRKLTGDLPDSAKPDPSCVIVRPAEVSNVRIRRGLGVQDIPGAHLTDRGEHIRLKP